MKTRTVLIPFAGSVAVHLDDCDGETDEESIDRALDVAGEAMRVEFGSADCECDVVEVLRNMITGNVRHFSVNEAEIVDEETEDDE